MLFLLLVPFAVGAQDQPGPQQVTFAQITDAHIFDEGWKESGSDPFYHALDDRTALHWAVDEIDRLYLSAKPEDRISFIVYTGDFGLQNVFFPQNSPASTANKYPSCSIIPFKSQPGLPPISSELAEEELVTELSRLAVRRLYVVPGNNDLIDEQVVDWPRYACFIEELRAKLLAVPQPVYLESLTADSVVNAGPVRMVGLNTASFKDISNYSGACPDVASGSSGAPSPGCPLPQLRSLQKLLQSGGQTTPLLLFTHIPDLIDPFRQKSSWQIDATVRSLWEQDACDSHLLGIFTGHLHSADRSIYATNTGTARLAIKKCVADKTWVTPPLAVKFQTDKPVQARGFVVVTIRNGAGPRDVQVEPRWYPDPTTPTSEYNMTQSYFFLILGVILFAGILGGFMNYTSVRDNERAAKTGSEGGAMPSSRKGPRWPGLSRSLLLGIGAAFLLPLFLNMISSTLVDNIYSAEKGYDYPKILVFLGFCLVAAISSTPFIKTISDRVLKLAEEAKKDSSRAKEDAEKANAKADKTESKLDPILQSFAEPEEVATPSDAFIGVQHFTAVGVAPHDDDERRVLRALANSDYRLRTVGGVVAETEMPMEKVTEILNRLKDKNLANSTTVVIRGKTTEGFRWFITPEGREALAIAE